MCETQEKQVEILSACKCKSIARVKWKATTCSHCVLVQYGVKKKWCLSVI